MDKKSLSSLGKTALPVNKIVAAVAILAGVVLLLSWIIPSLSEKDAAPTTESAAQPERQAVALAPTTSAATAIPDGVVPVSGALPVDVTQEGIVSGANGVGIDAEQAEDDSNKRRVVISDQALQQITANQPANESVVVDGQTQTSAVTSVHQLKPIANEIKGDTQTVVRSEPVSKKVSSEKKVISEKKVVPKKPKAAVERKIVKSSASTAKATSSNLSATGKGYALQLAASSDPAALKKLAVSSGLQTKTKIYKNQSNGKYVLIYGEYASAAAAKAAVPRLPASVQNTKPWPKSYAQIRTEQGK